MVALAVPLVGLIVAFSAQAAVADRSSVVIAAQAEADASFQSAGSNTVLLHNNLWRQEYACDTAGPQSPFASQGGCTLPPGVYTYACQQFTWSGTPYAYGCEQLASTAQANITSGFGIGASPSTCSCAADGRECWAAGIDCSGFVWRLIFPNEPRLTCGGFSAVSSAGSFSSLRPGDIILRTTNPHVMIFKKYEGASEVAVIHANWGAKRVSSNKYPVSELEGSGYAARIPNPFISDNPGAEVSVFEVTGGRARWELETLHQTERLLIEAGPTATGPWTELVRVDPLVGRGEIDLPAAASKHEYFRLVEIETSGRRLAHRVASSRMQEVKPQKDAMIAPSSEQLWARIRTAAKSREHDPGPRRQSVSARMAIYTTAALQPSVQAALASYWTQKGCLVSIHVVDGFPQPADAFRSTLKASIASHAISGTSYVLLVGDANDYREFSVPWPGDWEAIRQSRISQGYPAQGQPEKDLIPTHVVADTRARDEGMSYFSPYWFTDQPYADTDGDGLPDLAVSRLPFTTETEVLGYATKLWSEEFGGARKVAFFTGDRDWNGTGDGARAVSAATMARRILPAATITDSLLWSQTSWPDYNAAPAAFINTKNPDLIVMLGSYSTRYNPADFFEKSTLQSSWSMSRISTSHATMVIAASCEAAEFARTERPGLGLPVSHEFLATPDKGAVIWIGPTAGTWQSGNSPVARYLLEELYRNPFGTCGDAFVRAIRRVLIDYAADQEICSTARSYVYLGDPMLRFQKVPSAEVSAYVRPVVSGGSSGGTTLLPFDGRAALTCPSGDGDGVVVRINIPANEVIAPLTPQSFEVTRPESGIVIGAVSPPTLGHDAAGDHVVEFDFREVSGCGDAVISVALSGVDVGGAAINVKSTDSHLENGSTGRVDVLDFSNLAAHIFSSACDCVYAKTYMPCLDYVPPDTVVAVEDWAFWGGHYNHKWQLPLAGSDRQSNPSTPRSVGVVYLKISETDPLLGARKIRADVLIESSETYSAMVLVLRNTNTEFSFAGWHPSIDYPGLALGVERVKDQEVLLGVLNSDEAKPGFHNLGYFEFDVMTDGVLPLLPEDFAMISADVLADDGTRFVMGVGTGVSFERSVTSPRYKFQLAQNYPNPFNPQTTIAFSLENASNARLTIYDVNGATVRTLVDEHRQPGNYREPWDGRSDTGESVASGVYFYRLTAASFASSRKLVLLR